jgi:hypothetical protein
MVVDMVELRILDFYGSNCHRLLEEKLNGDGGPAAEVRRCGRLEPDIRWTVAVSRDEQKVGKEAGGAAAREPPAGAEDEGTRRNRLCDSFWRFRIL